MDLNALLELLSTHMAGGSANNPFASLLSLLRGSGQGGNVNALSSGGTGNVFANLGANLGQAGPPSLQSLFGNMLGGGFGGGSQTDTTMPSMGQRQQGGFPMNALAGMFGGLGSGHQGGGFQANPRLPYLGGGAGGIYPQQGGYQV